MIMNLLENELSLFWTDFDRLIRFFSIPKLSKLRKVLIAYSVHVNPNVGYCQAMNFLAALLLIIFDGNERHALM